MIVRMIFASSLIFTFLAIPISALDPDIEAAISDLYIVIREGPREELAKARSQIRAILEDYFTQMGVPLPAYPLPVGPGRWKITQGNSTKWSHSEQNQFSWDFELVDKQGNLHPYGLGHYERPRENYSYGMPILAARDGYIWLSGDGIEGAEPSNTIVIHHGDDTRSIYDHIAVNGFAVEKGDTARQGQIIGYIGYTGTGYPHLHFSVRINLHPEWPYSHENWTLPIRFQRYYLLDPKTEEVTEVVDGVPLEGEIIAVTEKEARNPSVPWPSMRNIPELAFEPATQEVILGERFSLLARVRNVIDLFGACFELRFDSDILGILEAKPGDLLGNDVIFLDMLAKDPPSIAVTRKKGAEGVNGAGTIASITFAAISSGVTTVSFDPETIKLTDTEGLDIKDIEVKGTEIKVVRTDPWDVNRDGVVNILDLIIVCRYLGEEDFPSEHNPDVNGDGKINTQDLELIVKNFGRTTTL